MVELVMCYDSGAWILTVDIKRKLTEKLRRSAKVSRLEHVRNKEIRRQIMAQYTIVHVEKKEA